MKPDFIIIGAQKCGTSSLYEYIVEHPRVVPAATKEVHFFDLQFQKGMQWYESQFPPDTAAREGVITGEASPYYIFHPLVPERIKRALPGVKLITLLRNPVDRAYSHFMHNKTRGRETITFEEALTAEPKRLDGEIDKLLADPAYNSHSHQRFSYVTRGLYLDQLKTWRGFFPESLMLVLCAEEFFSSPESVMKTAFEFLDLPYHGSKEYKVVNKGEYSGMDPTTRKKLEKYFANPNRLLSEYLGRKFPW